METLHSMVSFLLSGDNVPGKASKETADALSAKSKKHESCFSLFGSEIHYIFKAISAFSQLQNEKLEEVLVKMKQEMQQMAK